MSIFDRLFGSKKKMQPATSRPTSTPRSAPPPPAPVEIVHSNFANDLDCPECGKKNASNQWPARGDFVPYFSQVEHGAFSVPISCPHCHVQWHVVWDSNPGPIGRVLSATAQKPPAATDAPGLSCQSCKSTQRPVRLWLDTPQPDQYLCQNCIHAKGFDNPDRDSPLPPVMPQLIDMTEIRDAPGIGVTAFMAASEASKRDRPVESVEKYLAAIEAGLTPAFDAVARNYVGGMFLKQGHIQAALLQFRRALFDSPQAPETAHLAAIRFSIVSEELGATNQAKKAGQIAGLAATRMKSPPSPESLDLIRRIVREHRS